jgi:hypothetical protein
VEHVARMRGVRNAYKIKLENLKGRPHGRPRCWWEHSITMDLKEVGYRGVDSILLDRDRDQWRALLYMVMNLGVPWKVRNFFANSVTDGFLRRTVLHGVSRWVSKSVVYSYHLVFCFSLVTVLLCILIVPQWTWRVCVSWVKPLCVP